MSDFRFLIDQNISPKTTAFLRELGLDVIEVGEAIVERTDEAVYSLAKRENLFLMTYDVHAPLFFQTKRALFLGLILIRVHPQTTEVLHPALKLFFDKVDFEELRDNIVMINNQNYQVMPLQDLKPRTKTMYEQSR